MGNNRYEMGLHIIQSLELIGHLIEGIREVSQFILRG